MGNTKHTPEPWDVDNQTTFPVIVGSDAYVSEIWSTGENELDQANAARIVACVNAMTGIEDPQNLRDTWEAIKHLELDAYYKAEEKNSKLEKTLQYRDKQLETILKIADLQLEKIKAIETLIGQIDRYLDEAGMVIKGDRIHQLIKKAVSIKEGGQS